MKRLRVFGKKKLGGYFVTIGERGDASNMSAVVSSEDGVDTRNTSEDTKSGSRSLAVQEFRRHWGILLASVFALAFCAPASLYSIGIFFKPLNQEYGFSRGDLSVGLSLFSGSLALMPVFVGFVVDRFGERILTPLSLLGLGILYAMASRLPPDIRVFWIGYSACALVGSFSTALVFSRIISLRFNHARGTALAIALMGLGLSSMLMPGAVGYVVAEHGWRFGFFIFGVTTSLTALPVAAALWFDPVKHSPPRAASPKGEANAPVADRTIVLTALRSREFVIMTVAFFLIMVGSVGVIPQFVPLLTDRGMAPETAALYAGSIGVCMIVGRLVSGVLVDRVHAPWVAAGAMAICAASLAGLALGGPAILGAIGVGLSIGAELDFAAYIVGRYFPTKIFGRMYGVVYTALAVGGALSSAIVGIWFDQTGSYQQPLFGCAAAMALSGVLFMLLPKYPKLD